MGIEKTKTGKGEKYLIKDNRFVVIAYHYSWHTRYYIKNIDETRFRQVKASTLWDIAPCMFKKLREEIGLRNYRM